MIPTDAPIGDDDLQAFVDDQLPPNRREAVERYVADRPELTARVGAYRAQREALAAGLAAKLDEPIPHRLRVASVLAARRRRHRTRLARVAAAVGWLMLGGVAGWFANQAVITDPERPERSLAGDAFSAYRTYVGEVRHPVEVAASEEAHLVAWLSKRLGQPVRAPDLAGLGFRLMGGRLLPAATGPAAQFLFEDATGRRLAIYVRTDLAAAETAYVIAGDLERETLLAVATAVYDQLD
jgi:anti-sigma factor RsiW